MSSVGRGAIAIAAMGTLGTVLFSGHATAAPIEAPQLSFEATAADQITATIHNPNGSGVCWAVIALDGSVHEFTEHDPSGMAGPGQTIKPVRSGLAPGTYQLTGFCGTTKNSWDQVKGKDYSVTVGATKPSTGSF